MTFSGPVVLALVILSGGGGFLQGKVGLYTAAKKLVGYFQRAKAAVDEVRSPAPAPAPVESEKVTVEDVPVEKKD